MEGQFSTCCMHLTNKQQINTRTDTLSSFSHRTLRSLPFSSHRIPRVVSPQNRKRSNVLRKVARYSFSCCLIGSGYVRTVTVATFFLAQSIMPIFFRMSNSPHHQHSVRLELLVRQPLMKYLSNVFNTYSQGSEHVQHHHLVVFFQ